MTTDPSVQRPDRRRTVANYLALTKPRIIELLLVTTVPVMFLAEGGVPSLWLVLATLVMLIAEGVAPAWMIAAIVAREIAVSGLRLAALERGVVMGARDLGKLKTWVQTAAAIIAGLQAAGAWDADVAWWVLLAATLLTWISGLDYARVAPRVLRGEGATS